jgi:two-component system phosphate regulon sensor histidine kinase PhoR
MRLRWKLPLAFALTTLVFAGIVALAVALLLRGVFLDRLEDDMTRQARQFAATLVTAAPDLQDAATLQKSTQDMGKAGEVRFTVISRTGTVLADSDADPTALDDHSDRPEVRQALAGHEGRARRDSATLGEEMVYVAVPLPPGEEPWAEGAVRAALPANRIDALLAESWRIPLIVWAILLLPTLALAYVLSHSLVKPLTRLRFMTARVAEGDLSYRTSIRRSDELGELASSLNSMAAQLESRAEELSAEIQRSDGVLTAMTEGVLLTDGDGRLLRANPAAERILRARLAGTEGHPLVRTARAFPADTLAEKARRAGRPLTEEVELAGGRSLAVEVVPLRASGLQHAQTLFVIRDETARRATERMRRDFVANVSHELKTPLSALSLLAQILRDAIHEDPVQAEKSVKQLSAEVTHLTELTNELLTLSRLEEAEHPDGDDESAGRAASLPGFVPVDLSATAARALEEVRGPAEERRHTLTLETEPGLMVMGDEGFLRTIARNLLENAVRYTEPGGHVKLRTRAEVDSQGEEWAVLSVEDDGVGIPAAEQQRIFERFYRIDKDRSRQTGGTGLGLSIVRHLAEYHRGGVEVESQVGVGSVFTVRVPRLR